MISHTFWLLTVTGFVWAVMTCLFGWIMSPSDCKTSKALSLSLWASVSMLVGGAAFAILFEAWGM